MSKPVAPRRGQDTARPQWFGRILELKFAALLGGAVGAAPGLYLLVLTMIAWVKNYPDLVASKDGELWFLFFWLPLGLLWLAFVLGLILHLSLFGAGVGALISRLVGRNSGSGNPEAVPELQKLTTGSSAETMTLHGNNQPKPESLMPIDDPTAIGRALRRGLWFGPDAFWHAQHQDRYRLAALGLVFVVQGFFVANQSLGRLVEWAGLPDFLG